MNLLGSIKSKRKIWFCRTIFNEVVRRPTIQASSWRRWACGPGSCWSKLLGRLWWLVLCHRIICSPWLLKYYWLVTPICRSWLPSLARIIRLRSESPSERSINIQLFILFMETVGMTQYLTPYAFGWFLYEYGLYLWVPELPYFLASLSRFSIAFR